ncbi:MAG: glutaredoxin [Proteobacteria bacterium]|nr:glutaredoxin [Pseudomonadota bacterium]
MVTVYTTRFCGYCVRAKRLLKKRDIPFEEVSLEGNHERRMELVQQTGWRTVPMIFVGDEFIGGSDELHRLDKSGKLAAMVA